MSEPSSRTCSAGPCNERAGNRGLCPGHYNMARYRNQLPPPVDLSFEAGYRARMAGHGPDWADYSDWMDGWSLAHVILTRHLVPSLKPTRQEASYD